MTDIILKGPNSLIFNNKTYRCTIGRNGFTNNKVEGDAKTPIGEYVLLIIYYRVDKISSVKTKLYTRIINENDLWSDDILDSANYNRHVLFPYKFSHEKLYREDDLYDVFITTSYNTNPYIVGKGSAIFIHVASKDFTPTLGCVALEKNDLIEIISQLSSNSRIIIKPDDIYGLPVQTSNISQ